MDNTLDLNQIHMRFVNNFSSVVAHYKKLVEDFTGVGFPNPQLGACMILCYPYYNKPSFKEDELYEKASELYELILEELLNTHQEELSLVGCAVV